jgi:tetratricopeptide (TPR) repeat protein
MATILAMTLIAYLPAIRGGFIWDDDLHITGNKALRTAQGLIDIWIHLLATPQYYPLTHTTWWAAYQLFGIAPLGYHLVNVILHGLSAGILWLVLRRLSLPAAWSTAAVFALHPVHVESVAWVTELKNVQSGFFYLLAALAYLGFAFPESVPGNVGLHGRRARYALALGAFVAALASKTVVATFPLAMLVIIWWKRGRLTRADLMPLLPFLIIGVAGAVTTSLLEVHRVNAHGPDWDLSPAERVLRAGRAWWFYIAKDLVPYPLVFVYPRWTIDVAQWWQWLFPLAAAATMATLWALRTRIGRGPVAALLYFGITVAPALGFVNIFLMLFSWVADHFQYLASIGIITLTMTLAASAVARLSPRRYSTPILRVMSALLLVWLGVAVSSQARIYRTPETLWRDTLAKNPSAWMAHDNLGVLLFDEGEFAEAGDHFREAVRLRPTYVPGIFNLGNVALKLGRLDEARDLYERVVRLQPDLVAAHTYLGHVYFRQHEYEMAISQYQLALALNPNDPDPRRFLAAAQRAADVQVSPGVPPE